MLLLFLFCPSSSRVSLSSVFRRLVETWDGALQFLSQRCKSQQLNLMHLLLSAMVGRMAARGAQLRPVAAGLIPQADWELDLLREWAVHLVQTQAANLFRVDQRDSASTPKKRAHAAAFQQQQQAQEGAARMSPLDSIMHTVLVKLNPWSVGGAAAHDQIECTPTANCGCMQGERAKKRKWIAV